MTNVKQKIDAELSFLALSDTAKGTIQRKAFPVRHRPVWKTALATCAVFLLVGSVSAFAASVFARTTRNNEPLPELDTMYVVQGNEIEPQASEYAQYDNIWNDYETYGELRQALGINLLQADWTESETAHDIHLCGDGENYLFAVVYNENITLNASLALSEAQLQKFGVDYSEDSRFVEQYVSVQGYKVNLLQNGESYSADFVADGILYSIDLDGSLDELKQAVDAMHT